MVPSLVRAGKAWDLGSRLGRDPGQILYWGLAHTWLSVAQEDKARARQPAVRAARPRTQWRSLSFLTTAR